MLYEKHCNILSRDIRSQVANLIFLKKEIQLCMLISTKEKVTFVSLNVLFFSFQSNEKVEMHANIQYSFNLHKGA